MTYKAHSHEVTRCAALVGDNEIEISVKRSSVLPTVTRSDWAASGSLVAFRDRRAHSVPSPVLENGE